VIYQTGGQAVKVKMIVTDLDNTLLQRDKTISNNTVDVFRRARERGVLVAFATARDFRFVTEYITPQFDINPDVLIADNGALALYNGKSLYRKMVPSTTVNTLIPRFDLVRCVSTEIAYYLSGEYSNDHWSIGKKDTVITDFTKEVENDAFYIDGTTNNPSRFLTESYPDIRTVAYSDVNLVTVVHREATKLNALIAVKNVLNIELNDIVAFGDDYSDIELLSYCIHSVAVANAIEECKAVANSTCGDCDEDGVACWIEENLL